MSLNIVHLVGRAGSDPEVRYFENNSSVCKVSLAVNRRTSKSDQPDWFKLEFWNKTAEIAANYVRKGSLIGVEGMLKIDTWTNREGHQMSTPVIRVNRLDLLGSKRDNNPSMMDNYGGGEF
ncbi:MAG: single-stranded DNA-binding protein [Cyanobacteria bacterium P01_G01_bin.54]